MQAVGKGYTDAIYQRRTMAYGERENFQLYRRGRYVEFNLVWGSRYSVWPAPAAHRVDPDVTPPLVRWEYDYQPKDGSPEAAFMSLLRSGIGVTPHPHSRIR